MNVAELEPGMPAPDFTLPSTNGEITLSELIKTRSVVLAFYSEDDFPGCQEELGFLRDEYSVFEYLEAEVLGISVGPIESQQGLLSSLGGLPFPLVSDTSMSLGRAYGVLDDTGQRYRRAVYVVNRWGNIAVKIPLFQPGDQAEWMEMLQALGLNVIGEDL